MNTRRDFLRQLGIGAAGLGLSTSLPSILYALPGDAGKPFFDISLAEFSFATSLYTGQMNHLDFPARAKKEFGISKVEYVSGFWKEKPTNLDYLEDLKKRAEENGVTSHLIMVDGMGNLGDTNETKRQEAIANHSQWIDAARYLGCYAIRVNLDGDGTDEEVAKNCIEAYGKLVEIGAKNEIMVLVENHIGPSVNPDWLVSIMKKVKNKHAGLLVDTENFVRYKVEAMTLEAFKTAKVIATFDKYDGVKKLMPYAKGVSLKTHKIDSEGKDPETDYARLLKIVKDSGFKGTIGVEYEGAFLKNIMQMEGNYLPETEGIKATKSVLEKIGAEV